MYGNYGAMRYCQKSSRFKIRGREEKRKEEKTIGVKKMKREKVVKGKEERERECVCGKEN